MEETGIRNIAMFSSGLGRQAEDLEAALGHLDQAPVIHAVSDHWPPGGAKPPGRRGREQRRMRRLSFADAGFLETPISFKVVLQRIADWVRSQPAEDAGCGILVIDMSWALATNSATANFETWMEIAETLANRIDLPVVSLYNRNLMIDEQLLTALRGHPHILTAARIHDNPHWLPRGSSPAARCASRSITG